MVILSDRKKVRERERERSVCTEAVFSMKSSRSMSGKDFYLCT